MTGPGHWRWPLPRQVECTCGCRVSTSFLNGAIAAWAPRALATVEYILAGRGLGVRLETSWCWQRAVRFYLARGMWVMMWKRDLVFCWTLLGPAPLIDVGADSATLSVGREKETIVLAHARRCGDTLELAEPDPPLEQSESLGEAPCYAEGPLSLAIALRDWPLVRGIAAGREKLPSMLDSADR